nr:ulp1 protease family, C-terminal catalytic domain-containing protein [Tanacetum cinerariifolium]
GILNPSRIDFRLCRTDGDKVVKHVESNLRVQQDKTIFAAPYLQCLLEGCLFGLGLAAGRITKIWDSHQGIRCNFLIEPYRFSFCLALKMCVPTIVLHHRYHITRYGWDLSYKTWIHPGEPDLPPPPPVIDNTRQPQMSDMTTCLNDLSYIPPYNEQNEPTQGDIGETSNKLTQAKRNEFEELYASANEELYHSCDYVTRLDFMAKFTYFKVKGKLSDSIFNEILEFFQNVFPTSKGYKLPSSYYAIKKTFKTIGLGTSQYILV